MQQAQPQPTTSTALVPRYEPQEEVACPLCGERSHQLVFQARDVLFARPGEYRIVACSACELRYVSPRPTLDALGLHYPDEYGIYQPMEDLPKYLRTMAAHATATRWRKTLKRIEKVTGTLRPETRVVDVGSGLNNDFLIALQRMRGIQGVAVEFKTEAADYIRDKLHMQVSAGTLQDAHFPDASFDLVSMNEYLEHEPHPREVLLEARRITAKGGHISIEVPYVEGAAARMFGSRWSQVDAPRHLIHFTHKTLEDMLRRTGFELVHTETYSMPYMIGFSVLVALGRRTLGRPSFFDLWFAWLASLPFTPFLPWLDEYRFAIARAV